MEHREDNMLAKHAQEGITADFGELYDRYAEPLYRFVYYKVFSKEIAEDLVSDVFHKALKQLHSFNPTKGNFSQWIYTIARNTVIDHYRTHKRNIPI